MWVFEMRAIILKLGLTLLKLRSPLHTQSILNTPPSARAERPGGSTQLTRAPSLLDSVARRASPQNLPDS